MKLLRLEQRRVLNADFSFTPHALTLSQVDGDLTVREISSGLTSHIEFDLAGSIWQDDGSTGTFAIDNSTPGHSILSVAKGDLEHLSGGVAINAAASSFDLHFDVQSSSLDLSHMYGTLVAEGFGNVRQTESTDHDVQVADVSLSASRIDLTSFHGDEITLNASEVDFTGGQGTISGTTLTVLSTATPTIELGGLGNDGAELNFTDRDIAALDAGFHSIHFSALSSGESSALTVDESGADFSEPLASGRLHLEAATIQIHGDLTSHGGRLEIDAGEHGTLLVTGSVDVSDADAGDSGGTVHLLGERIGLIGDARVDASGDAGGGEVLIGGDEHGTNDSIHHASAVWIGSDAEVHADAIHHGDGGKVVVWSDEATQHFGSLTARGGSLSGDGGSIETSSLSQLILSGSGDASAVNGHAGTWLLDPYNVAIRHTLSGFGVDNNGQLPNFTPTTSGSEVTDTAIEAQLNAGTNVVISTANTDGGEAGNVTQSSDASIDVVFSASGTSATFTINAANNILLDGGITAANSTLNVVLNANTVPDDPDLSSGNVNINATINTNGGTFSSTGVDFDSTGTTITASGGVALTHTGTVELGAISTGTGFGGATLLSGANIHETVHIGEGNLFVDGGNLDLVVLEHITATETVFLLADRDVIVEATITAGGPAAQLNPVADLVITTDADSDGDGGFWLRENGDADARLNAGGNIVVVGAKLHDGAGNSGGNVSLRIDAEVGADPQIVAGGDLTLVANFGFVADAGDIVIDGRMEATEGTLVAFFTGTTLLGADQLAGTDIRFQDAVQLTNDVLLTAGNDVTFASTLDDDGDSGTNSELSLTAGGEVLFVDAIGGSVGPDGLKITGAGTIDFLNAVTIQGDLAVTATSETDRVTFQAAVTTTNNGSVTVTNAGLLETSSVAQFQVGGAFVQNGAGSTELGASIVTTDGDVSFAQAVVLTDDVTINTSNANGDITFSGPIDSEISGANEVQIITFQDATGGSFTITWNPPDVPGSVIGPATTADIPLTATADEVRTAFVAAVDAVFKATDPSLAFTDADVLVSGDPGGPFTLTFRGAFRGTDVSEVIVSGAELTPIGGATSVLTTAQGQAVVPEHNSLTLIGGGGDVRFGANIGDDFVDDGLGVDRDQTLGDLTVRSTTSLTFQPVTVVRTAGTIDLGADSAITGGILIDGGSDSTTFDSGAEIRINGVVTCEVDLTLRAAGDITLTDAGSLFTNADHSITLVADSDGNAFGDVAMSTDTEINVGAGFIDVQGAEVFLGKLTSDSLNSTDADNPAIRVVATFGAIFDVNADAENLIANQRPVDENPGAGVLLQAVNGIGSDDELETDLASLSAFNHDLSERQSVTLTNAQGGTFTLTWTAPGTVAPATTAAIPFNASAEQVQGEFLRTFDTLGIGEVAVSGSDGGPYLFTFQGSLRTTNVAELVASNGLLIGEGASVTAATIHDPLRADNNIRIRDVGTTAGRVDLMFVQNQANQTTRQFAREVISLPSADGTQSTELTFSAATPGQAGNDIEITFTIDNETHVGATEGVPVISVSDSSIVIDLDSQGTTANAVRDAINANHQANQLVRARITEPDFDSNPSTPGTNDLSGADGISITLSGAGAEDGVIDILVESGDLRVVADNSRLLLSEMRQGIDTLNPPDLAVPAIRSENTIQLTADTIEIFDDILAIQATTQTVNAVDMNATVLTIGDPSVFTNFDGTPFEMPFFIKLTSEVVIDNELTTKSEVMRVTMIDGHELTVDRGQNTTTAIAHRSGTIIETINRDNGIRGFIDIQARVNFVLGPDRVISTDDHYLNSLNLAEDVNGNGILDHSEDSNGDGLLHPSEDYNDNGLVDLDETSPGVNGVLDVIEDFDQDGVLTTNTGEDTNRNGTLDAGEDLNGDGLLQLRGHKPATTAEDDFFSASEHDVIRIVADFDEQGVPSGPPEGRVLLGLNSTISTDNGIEQQIAPRPIKIGTDPLKFEYAPNTAFFSGQIVTSNLQSRFLTTDEILPDGSTLKSSTVVFLGTLTFTIGVPGEKNLVLDIDWGDHDRTHLSPIPPTTPNVIAPKFENGVYVFDAKVDQHATQFLIPEGGAKYSIPHEYSDNALNLRNATGDINILEPGRTLTTDPMQVRFAVSQHLSITIDGQSVLDPTTPPDEVGTAAENVPENAPFDSAAINSPYAADDPPLMRADPLFQLSSTNVLDNPDVFLPRFDNGVANFVIPTSRPTAPVPRVEAVSAPELPKPAFPESLIVTSSQLTTESIPSSASSSSVTTDEFFELRWINEEGESVKDRLSDLAGEGLLNRELFEDFVRELGDGDYEIWFITREMRSGALLERPVIQFRLESGRVAPPADDSSNLFQPPRLIPVPVIPPQPAPPPNGPATNPLRGIPEDSQDESPSGDFGLSSPISEGGWSLDQNGPDMSTSVDAPTETAASLESAAVVMGVTGSAGWRWRKNRFKPCDSSRFSKTARWARRRSDSSDDQ